MWNWEQDLRSHKSQAICKPLLQAQWKYSILYHIYACLIIYVPINILFVGEMDWSAEKHSLWVTHCETFIMVS
jgi:hypothetical protein